MSKPNAGLAAAYTPISTLTIPQHWSAEQAMSVWEFLDEVARCVWDRYELPLVELIKAGQLMDEIFLRQVWQGNPDLQVALQGAEVLIRVSAYMDPWGATPPLDWWTQINRVRALENMAYVVACNQGAQRSHYPPFSWPGGSMVVDYDGRILTQADPGPGEKIVVGPIDIAALRSERERRRILKRRRLEAEAHVN